LVSIIIASKNKGKVSEIIKILSLKGVSFEDLNSLDFRGDIEECGKTFLENALIKAETVFARYGLPVIADDSGLCVSALGEAPGVFSARFAGPGASDRDNNQRLLQELRDIPEKGRTAWFYCVGIFFYGDKSYFFEEGRVDGLITRSPIGEYGFGYDPLFYLPELKKTMAQLPDDVKNQLSHRASAFQKLKKHIEAYLKGH
jgi:XTP/dITP diphosphohydrolase